MRDSPFPIATGAASGSSRSDIDRLFALSLDLMCIAGLDGYFKKVNPSWTRVLGWSEQELLSRPVAEFMHPDDRERTLAARALLAKGTPISGLENRYLCKDGSYRWLSWQSSIEEGDTTVFAVARDITERMKQDQEQLVLSKLEAIGILAGGLAHDFNNLLGGMLLNLDMVELSGALNEEQHEYIRHVQRSIRDARVLSNQLIAFAHGGASVRRTLDLKTLLHDSVEEALRGGTVRGVFDIAPDLWSAEVDEAQIGQVVQGVVLNAREASPDGGTVRVQAHNETAAAKEGSRGAAAENVRIVVSDEGAGIAPEVLPKIFDPYFSTKQRGTQKGMGLGLTICRTVIRKHGGSITVHSEPGRGTTVTILLPAKRVEAPPAAAPVAAVDVGPRRILVMDDEEMFREVAGQALRRLGYRVVLARHGDEALAQHAAARASGAPFDAVVLDLTVKGGKGGLETMKALRALDPDLPAVLMSGYTNDETFRDFARHGFHAAISKPFSIEALNATIANLVQRADTRRSA